MLPKRHLIGSPVDMYSYANAVLNVAGGKREKAKRAVDNRFNTDPKARAGLCKDLSDSLYKDELKQLAIDLDLSIPQKATKAQLCKMIADYAESSILPIPENKYDISEMESTDIKDYITAFIKTGNLAALADLFILNPKAKLQPLDIKIAIENNRLDVLEFLKKKGVFTNKFKESLFWNGLNLNEAFRTGNIPLLEFIYKNMPKYDFSSNRFPTNLDSAVALGTESTIDWLMNPPRNLRPTVDTANKASSRGMLHLLKILETRNILPNHYGADGAANKGKLNTLKWLATKNILPTDWGLWNAILEEHFDVVRWILDRGITLDSRLRLWNDRSSPEGDLANNFIIENGNLEGLKFLYGLNRKYLPDSYGAGRAARMGKIDIVKSLADKGIFPDQEGMNYTAEKGNLDVIKLLSQYPKAMLPNATGAYYAQVNNKSDVVNWLSNRNIHPRKPKDL